MRRLFAAIAAGLLLAGAFSAKATSDEELFPRPYALQPQIRFWKRIYTEVDTNGGLVHDAEHLDVVYETLRMPEGLSNRAFQARVDERKETYRRILLGLADGHRDNLSPDEERVLQLWPTGVASETLRHAAEDVRFQLGQADRFREGVVRSGRWEAHIRHTLAVNGVPPELAALPHVESSYNPEAYSRVGAAGIWQFMRSTARRFLRVDNVVDERFDPWRSSEAAAHFLAENYRLTGSWPLAVTAYNHGTGGVKRAEQILGTEDIGTIVRRYKSPTFGFASRNFYTSFLAALDVSSDPQRYFGAIQLSAPFEPRNYVLPRPFSVGALQHAMSVDLETLRANNLALRTPFWRGRRFAPAGYVLRLPGGSIPTEELALSSKQIEPPRESHVEFRTRTYRVAKGDTVGRIAHRFRISERTLLATNHLNPRHLRPGMLLTISSVRTIVEPVSAPERVEIPVAQAEPAPAETVAPTVVASSNAPESEPGPSSLPAPPSIPAPSAGDGPAADAPTPAAETPQKSLAASQTSSGTSPPPSPPTETLAGSAASASGPPPQAPVASPEPEGPKAPSNEVVASTPPPPAESPAGAAPAAASSQEVAPPSAPKEKMKEKTEEEPRASARASRLASNAPQAPKPPPSLGNQALGSASPPAKNELDPATASMDASLARYRVDAKGFIEVQSDETLGHYAQWLNVSASRLRSMNALRPGRSVAIGRRLRLDFSRCSPAAFEEHRLAYHEALRREFFDTFEVAGTQEYVLRKGDTLWSLSRGEAAVPVWLLHQYNPDLDLASLRPGVRVTIPRLHKRGTTESGDVRASEGA
jgi:membrane-bound lytic murein transglycosylase D